MPTFSDEYYCLNVTMNGCSSYYSDSDEESHGFEDQEDITGQRPASEDDNNPLFVLLYDAVSPKSKVADRLLHSTTTTPASVSPLTPTDLRPAPWDASSSPSYLYQSSRSELEFCLTHDDELGNRKLDNLYPTLGNIDWEGWEKFNNQSYSVPNWSENHRKNEMNAVSMELERLEQFNTSQSPEDPINSPCSNSEQNNSPAFNGDLCSGERYFSLCPTALPPHLTSYTISDHPISFNETTSPAVSFRPLSPLRQRSRSPGCVSNSNSLTLDMEEMSKYCNFEDVEHPIDPKPRGSSSAKPLSPSAQDYISCDNSAEINDGEPAPSNLASPLTDPPTPYEESTAPIQFASSRKRSISVKIEELESHDLSSCRGKRRRSETPSCSDISDREDGDFDPKRRRVHPSRRKIKNRLRPSRPRHTSQSASSAPSRDPSSSHSSSYTIATSSSGSSVASTSSSKHKRTASQSVCEEDDVDVKPVIKRRRTNGTFASEGASSNLDPSNPDSIHAPNLLYADIFSSFNVVRTSKLPVPTRALVTQPRAAKISSSQKPRRVSTAPQISPPAKEVSKGKGRASEKYQCPYCALALADKMGMVRHLIIHSRPKLSSLSLSKKERTALKKTADEINEKIKSFPGMKKLQEDPGLVCSKCGVVFARKDSLKRHANNCVKEEQD